MAGGGRHLHPAPAGRPRFPRRGGALAELRDAARRVLFAAALGSCLTQTAWTEDSPPSETARPDTTQAAPSDSAAVDRSIFRFLDRRAPNAAPSPGTEPAPADSLGAGVRRDSLGVRFDSLGAGSLGAGPGPDSLSLGSLGADPGSDSLGVGAGGDFGRPGRRPGPTFRFEADWGDRAVDRTPRELFAWSSPLRTIESGNPFTPDPLDWGDLPGREPVAFLLAGVPVNPPGMPEATPDPFAPSWIQSVEIRPPSPLRLPNNPTGGALVEVEWIVPDSALTVSGARLSDGSTGANTDEFYFARPGEESLFRLLWADHKTSGRLLYGPGQGSQTLVGYDHELGDGTVSLWAQHQFARQRLLDTNGQLTRRWLWDRNAYTLGYDGAFGSWETDLDVAWSWHRYGWEGETPARRKDGVQQAILRASGPGDRVRPLFSVQIDRHHQRYWEPGRISFEDRRVGLGFAGGLGGMTGNGRYELSLGRSDPGTEEGGLVYGAEGDVHWGGWALQGYAGRARRARLLPRLGNHLYLQVAQGLAIPEADEDPEAEVVDAVELWGRRGGPAGRLGFGVRGTRIQGAISAEAVGLARLTPDGLLLSPLPDDALDATVSVLALHVEAERGLGYGVSVRADGAVRTADPDRDVQLWMAPAEARGRLDWRALLFGEALDLDLFVRGQWSGERATTLGLVDGAARLDAGGTAQVDALSLWLLFVNLTDAQNVAGSADGGAMILPIRSFRMGLTWRFLD